MCPPASEAHHEHMINDITFASVRHHQQALLDEAASYRLARRATTRPSARTSLASKWNRLRHARSQRPAVQPQALRPATTCGAN
jgi:hypothetical protein